MKTCKIADCDRPSRTLEMCTMHYSRFRRTGKTSNSHSWAGMTPDERFWSKVARTDPGECWEWTGAKQPSGHGVFRTPEGRNISAYWWPWQKINGPVPAGMVLDHIECDNPSCVNPAHLAVSTIGENVLRGHSESAQHARKTHCKQGHPLSGDNLRINVRGPRGGSVERVCRTCERNRRRKRTE